MSDTSIERRLSDHEKQCYEERKTIHGRIDAMKDDLTKVKIDLQGIIIKVSIAATVLSALLAHLLHKYG
jgi:hypothetical protein